MAALCMQAPTRYGTQHSSFMRSSTRNRIRAESETENAWSVREYNYCSTVAVYCISLYIHFIELLGTHALGVRLVPYCSFPYDTKSMW